MPLTMDIAEFNNGPQNNGHFRDLIFAYQQSLLSLANAVVVVEYSLYVGTRHFSSQVGHRSFLNLIEYLELPFSIQFCWRVDAHRESD